MRIAHMTHTQPVFNLTFLDPFTGRGLLDWTYGTKRLGSPFMFFDRAKIKESLLLLFRDMIYIINYSTGNPAKKTKTIEYRKSCYGLIQ